MEGQQLSPFNEAAMAIGEAECRIIREMGRVVDLTERVVKAGGGPTFYQANLGLLIDALAKLHDVGRMVTASGEMTSLVPDRGTPGK